MSGIGDREAVWPPGHRHRPGKTERVTTISLAESSRQVEELVKGAEAAARTGPVDDAVAAWRRVLGHPCAHHQVIDYEIIDDIHQLLRAAGRYEEAIEAKREAIAAGYSSQPDPEADIAECLLAAGRRVEADRLYAELRTRDPEDVWLNNSAAYAYRGVDDRKALRWSLDGIDLAITTGDHDQVVGQLLDCAERSWDALGEAADHAVIDRVEAFQRSWVRPPWEDRWPERELRAEQPCSYCGWNPSNDPSRARIQPEGPAGPASSTQEPSLPVAVAWFDATEWQEAQRRWPNLLDELPVEHSAYSHEIEARTKRITKTLPGSTLHIAPLTVDGLVSYATKHADDPGTAQSRSRFAAELLRLGEATRWPPGRNVPCWCGSGRKYKQCCGPISPAVGA